MIAYARALVLTSPAHNSRIEFVLFWVFLQGGVPVFARLLNMRFLIRWKENSKATLVGCSICLAWLVLIKAHYADDERNEKIHTSSWACLIQVMAFTLGESMILGFMKKIPQELTIAFNTGKASGSVLEFAITIAFT